MTVKKAYPNNGNGGGTGEANTASTEGGLDITLPKDGDNLPFRGPNAPSGSLVEITQQATTIDFDLTTEFKTITGTTALDGFTVLPELTVVDGATTFGIIDGDNGPGQIQFVNRNVIPYEIVLVTIQANASIPIVHTGSRVVWLSYSYNFNTSTLTLHQDLASPGIDLSDQKILYSNLNYKDDGIGGTLNVLEFGTPEPYLAYDNTENLRALTKAAGGIRISGLVGTAEAATTSVNISAGVMSRIGGNVLIDANNSWQLAIPELLTPTIVQKFANSDSTTANFSFDNTLDTSQYSDGTALQPIPGSDPWAIIKIAVVARNTATPSIDTTVASFQPERLYKTEADAIAAAEGGTDKWTEGEDTRVFAPAFYIVFERNETDLSNATFIPMPPRRGAGGGGGSGAATSGYNQIQDNGTPLTQRQILNLLNAASIVDNPGNESTDVTFPGSTPWDTIEMQFATSSTVSGTPTEIPSAFTKMLSKGYTTVELIGIRGYCDDIAAAFAGDLNIQVYRRDPDNPVGRGLGDGTLVTTQTIRTTAVAIATVFDGDLTLDLQSSPVDFSAAIGKVLYFDISAINGWFLTRPSFTLVLRGV